MRLFILRAFSFAAFLGALQTVADTTCKSKLDQLAKKVHDGIQTVKEEECGVDEKLAALQAGQDEQRKAVGEVKQELKDIHARLRCYNEGNGLAFSVWGCFKAIESGKSWSGARDHCTSLGLELASFEDPRMTRKDLVQLGKDIGLKSNWGLWIGLSRQPPTGEWRWMSGATLASGSPLWRDGEPSNGGGDDAGVFQVKDGLGDTSSRTGVYFLCALH